MSTGFRVRSVEIEGFKGFASAQEIDFKSRHVFLLGQNGNGKSSIVEAVRWGLFGSAFRPNEVIKNQHYPGPCRVTVNLTRDGEPWVLHRILNLGAGSSSEPILTDRHGTRHPIREIMPQLDSLEAGEGTHIIFAPQSAPLQKQPEDLDAFEKTVFNYLGLNHPRALLSNLDNFLEDQDALEEELGDTLTSARNNIDHQITEERLRGSNIANAPPWGAGLTPSTVASEQKTRRFIEEITGIPPSAGLEGLSLDALVESAEQSLVTRQEQNLASLTKEAADLVESRTNLEELRRVQLKVAEMETAILDKNSILEQLYGGLTPTELHQAFDTAQAKETTQSIEGSIVRLAVNLIGREDSSDIPCPICGSSHNRQKLASLLHSNADKTDRSISETVVTLKERLQESQRVQELLTTEEGELHLLAEEAREVAEMVGEQDKASLANADTIDQLLGKFTQKESAVNTQIADQEAWAESKHTGLNKLKEENRYHQIQKRLNSLQAQRKELERAINSYNFLVAFGESVRAIRAVVNSLLREQLARDIPRVSDILSKAFNALVQHPWYDRLIISGSALPKLQLKVASSQDSTSREDPTGVLNGQAESALNIVPYFAFSQTDDTPTEVYLVMLDDPTRALDTEHINILLERLEELGRNVQLIVASQETERFREMVPKVFDKDNYIIIEPTGWSPDSGPNLNVYE